MPTPTVAATPMAFIRAMVAGYERYGADPSAALRAAQITPQVLRRADARLTAAQMESFSGAAMPLLDEVLAEFGGTAWLDIELKVDGIEEPVLELVAQHCRPGNFVITSFSRAAVARIRELQPQVPVGWLFDSAVRPERWRSLDTDYLAPHCRVLTPPLARLARNHGRRLITWTVNTPAAVRKAREAGAEIIITDFPDLVVQFKNYAS
jgi:glycerophosphoryl diester phosphodiesterase